MARWRDDAVRVRQKLDAVWAKYDKDNDGFITREEMREALRAECRVTSVEVRECVDFETGAGLPRAKACGKDTSRAPWYACRQCGQSSRPHSTTSRIV